MPDPCYARLAESGELERRCRAAADLLCACTLCPRACGVDRTAGEVGWCGAGASARIYRHMAHHGEEPPISGHRGSGVIFFSFCTMACVYCQNFVFSRLHEGRDRSVPELALMMGSLARLGCHNLNLVSGTQHLPAILDSLLHAYHDGVALPVVWNTSGYESPVALALLDGVVDVYLADLRYSSPSAASKYSDAPDYVEVSRAALVAMQRQVGSLAMDADGIARRGLLVRHLVLPNGLSGTREALRFLAREVGSGTYVSLMSQYYPAFRADSIPELSRGITGEEWEEVKAALEDEGLVNGWIQALPGGPSPMAGTELPPDG